MHDSSVSLSRFHFIQLQWQFLQNVTQSHSKIKKRVEICYLLYMNNFIGHGLCEYVCACVSIARFETFFSLVLWRWLQYRQIWLIQLSVRTLACGHKRMESIQVYSCRIDIRIKCVCVCAHPISFAYIRSRVEIYPLQWNISIHFILFF